MRIWFLSGTFLAMLAALYWLSPYSRAGAANLKQVRKTITPQLEKALSAKGLSLGAPIFIRIFKQSAQLELWVKKEERYELFKTYSICYHSGLLGPKLKKGDRQAPEGFYFVTPARMNPHSRYHLSFNLGYPNAYDRAHGRTGNYLMVHGDCVSIGCYAMTDAAIEEIYLLADAAHKHGQPFFRVHAFPFRLTAENLQRHQSSRWQSFWQNLKEGYDYFETHKRPPNIEVKDKRYLIEGYEQPARMQR